MGLKAIPEEALSQHLAKGKAAAAIESPLTSRRALLTSALFSRPPPSTPPAQSRAIPPEPNPRVLSDPELCKSDTSDDAIFFSRPSFVPLAGREYYRRLSKYYGKHLPDAGVILDLCSSWDSHLPITQQYKCVVAHGMQKGELSANPRADAFFVQDLNTQPELSTCRTHEFDAVLCAAGWAYLQRPTEVMAEVFRVLRPGGQLIVSFGAHVLQSKAVAGWLQRDYEQRADLLASYMHRAGFVDVEVEWQSCGTAAAETVPLQPGRDPATIIPIPQNDERLYLVRALRPEADEEVEQPDGDVARYDSIQTDSPRAPSLLDHWLYSWEVLLKEAQDLGIPADALPELPANPSLQDVRAAQAALAAILASFVSSGL